MPATPRATGRRLNHDPRSRNFAAPRRVLRPMSWSHTMGPVLDQGQINGCTGWSGADWLNSAKAIAHRRRWNLRHASARADAHYLGDPEGLELYKLATRNDPFRWVYPPTDGGSSGLGVAKALKSLGIIDEYLWTFDFSQMLAQAQAQPVLIGSLWTDAMSDPDAKGLIHIGTEAQIRSAIGSDMGHEYTLRGVNWSRKTARIRNHWSADWGTKGEALIPLAELERLIIEFKGDVMVPTLAAR
jgi:hypothetical protein